MNNYTPTAKRRIKNISEHTSFKKIITENSRYTILEIGRMVCKVTESGNVTWS